MRVLGRLALLSLAVSSVLATESPARAIGRDPSAYMGRAFVPKAYVAPQRRPGEPENRFDRADRIAHQTYNRENQVHLLSPADRAARHRAISLRGWEHRQWQIDGMVAEQGQRQRNGALPIGGGSYGEASGGRRAAKPAASTQVPPSAKVATPSAASDGGPDLVGRWISSVDQRWDAIMKPGAR